MICDNKNGLIFNRSEIITVPHMFTTRFGGVSSGVYATLNMSFTVGDDDNNVHENINRAAKAIGFCEKDVIASNQTHSAVCRKVGYEDLGTGIFKEKFSEDADALMTDEKGIVLLIRSADCTPILFYDEQKEVIAAAHSGWRGTLGNIVKSTFSAMENEYGSKASDIKAAIGPCISLESFEVGVEVVEMFENAGYGAYVDKKSYGKPHIDVRGICRFQLESLGITDIDVSDECTLKNNEKYFSHRAQGSKRGLLAALIGMRK